MTRIAPQEREIWKHYTGGLYQIIRIGFNEPYNVPCVIYKSLRDSKNYARPVDNFMETLGDICRFEKVESSSPSDIIEVAEGIYQSITDGELPSQLEEPWNKYQDKYGDIMVASEADDLICAIIRYTLEVSKNYDY